MMENGKTDTAITTTTTDTATVPTTTTVAEPKPARAHAAKPANVPTPPRSLADAMKIARTATMANAAELVAAANVGFIVNAPGKNVGRFTGTRITRFQNTTLLENPKWRFTDVQLLVLWRIEHPSATGAVYASPDIRRAVGIVAGVRAEFNRDGHGEPERIPAGFRSEPYHATA